MKELLEFNSHRYGPVKVYKENYGITVYCRVDEMNWKHFERNTDGEGWSDKERDWRGTIIGARSLRLDFELDEDTEVTKESVEALITKDYENDDLPWLHVERVVTPPEWDDMNDAQLWELENQLHRRKGDLEVELRQVKRDYARIWSLGDRKFDWGSQL